MCQTKSRHCCKVAEATGWLAKVGFIHVFLDILDEQWGV